MAEFSRVSAAALSQLLDSCSEGVGLVDPGSLRLVFANSTLLSILRDTSYSLHTSSILDLTQLLNTHDVQRQLAQIALERRGKATFRDRIVAKSGESLGAEFCFWPVVDNDESMLAVAVRPEVPSLATESVQRTDPLTGLADRTFLLARLATLLHGDRAVDQCCAVLFVDVNDFKQVNDAFGHRTGDQVLREVAERLATSIRSDDHVARFGGDEFVIVLESVCGRDETQPVLSRIRAAFDTPFSTPAGKVRLSVSIGVAEASPGCGTADDLIDAADRDMYAMKRAAVRNS